MSTRVFAWDSNPATDRHSYKQSVARAEAIVDQGRGFFITLPCGRRAVQLFPSAEELRVHNSDKHLVPFGRVYNKLMHPPNINYPIPAVGAHGRFQSVLANNYLPPELLGKSGAAQMSECR